MIKQRKAMFRISAMATRYGVSAESIRNWERQGLIPPAIRTPGGHRRYGLAHQRALDTIIVPLVPSDAGGQQSPR